MMPAEDGAPEDERRPSRPRSGVARHQRSTTVGVTLVVVLCLIGIVTAFHGTPRPAGPDTQATARDVAAPDSHAEAPAPTPSTTTTTLPAPLSATTTVPSTTSTADPVPPATPPAPSPIVSIIPAPVTYSTDTGSDGGTQTNSTAPGAPSNSDALAQAVAPALVDITAVQVDGGDVYGTGIVVSGAGEIITNDHVINGAVQLTATDVGDGQTYAANVVGTDQNGDLAVLQLEDATGLQTAPLGDSNSISFGEGVVAVGNANGAGGTPSYAGGEVTALTRHIVEQEANAGWSAALNGVIEFNAEILPGDSGGALVDANGEVVGIDTAILDSAPGGFAIPIDEALQVAQQIELQAG